MGNIRKLFSGAVTLALLAAVPSTAVAVPDAPPLPSTPSENAASFSSQKVKVFVTLKQQPNTPGGAGANLKQVQSVAKTLGAKYGFSTDRTFGYLVNGFSATVTASDIPALRRESSIGTVQKLRTYYPTMQDAADLTLSRQANAKYGVDGAGLVISIIDTGIDINHQDMRLDAGVAQKLQPAAGFTAKVPYGYNFADDNADVKDRTSSQHGMHVAGIAAANGGTDADAVANGRINGVAPNAQLLAMKVFSNDPAKAGGAGGDDIIAALEDSVKHGADIINMSLGSPNGNENDAYGEQRAIAAARAAGVEVIVAAGNEGQNGSATGENDDILGLWDDATVGSPSTGTDAWSVASIEGSSIVRLEGDVTGAGSTESFAYDLQVGESDGAAHEIVDGGYGTIDDMFAANPRGKWVLIQRGGAPGTEPLSFADKFANATINGATGVIIYNHATGGDEIPGMAGIDNYTVPGVAVGHADGLKILRKIQADSGTSVTLAERKVITANPDKLKPSLFTSWGSTPELGFKPEIAGIGGNVYSTVNDNKYATKSGTSMAAPHVAGVAALMLEQTAKDFPALSRGERVLRNRIALSNTAQIPMASSTVPYAPRQIGAGLVQTKSALETRVLATVDGKPYAELKEVKGSEAFTVTLKNESATPKAFTVGSTCVVNESNEADGNATKTSCSGTDSISASTSQVTVPANGSTTVKYTLKAGGSNHWVEGWVKFTSADATQPSLSLPYLGFAGSWSDEPIVDYPNYTGFNESVYKSVLGEQPTTTSLYTPINEGVMSLRDGEQFISPNGDNYADSVYAGAALLRNAKTLQVSVHRDDSAKTLVRALGKHDDVTRYPLKDQLSEQNNTFQEDLSDLSFNGTVYDPQLKSFTDVPDGKYIYRITATIGDGFEPQVLDLPFAIDRKAPEVEVLSVEQNDDGDYVVKVRVTDATDSDHSVASGVNAVQGRYTWPASVVVRDTDPQGDVYTLTMPGGLTDMVGYFELYASDAATNVVRKTIPVGDAALILESQATFDNLWGAVTASTTSDQTDELLVQDGDLVLTGRVSPQVKQVRLGSEVVDVPETGRFEVRTPVQDGDNTVVVEGLDAAGNVVATKTLNFAYDGQPPVFEIYSPATQPAELVDGKLVIEGKVTDNLGPVTSIRAGWDEYDVNPDGTFKIEVEPYADETYVELTAYDNNWQRGSVKIRLNNPNAPKEDLKLEANLGFDRNLNVVSGENPDLARDAETGEYTFTYKGTFNRVPDYFEVDGKPVTVNPDGTFAVTFPLTQGISKVNVKIEDSTFNVNTGMRVLFDTKAPGMTLDKPEINPDGALYLKEPGDVEFAGTVWDNAFGYNLTLNGNAVASFFSIDDPTPDANKRSFSGAVSVQDGDTILLGLYDQLENAYLQLIPVIVDAVKPVIKFAGAMEDEVVEPTRKITVRVDDDHLSEAKFYVDGKLVEAKQVAVTQAEGADYEYTGERDTLPDNALPEQKSAETETQSAPAEAAPTSTSNTAVLERAAADAAKVQAESGARAAVAAATPEENVTYMTFEVPVPLQPGVHRVLVTATDKAANVASAALNFRVNEKPTIVGPASLTLEPDVVDLSAAILAKFVVTDAEDGSNVLASVDASALQGLSVGQSANVTIYARDSFNEVTAKVVKVTLAYPVRTKSSNGVSLTGPMSSKTVMKVVRTDVDGGAKIVTTGVPLNDATKWLVTSQRAVQAIYYVNASGNRVKVPFTYSDAGYSFVAPAPGTVYLEYAAAPQLDPAPGATTDPGKGGVAGSGSASGSESAAGAESGAGSLAATGSSLGLALALTFGLVAAGVALAQRRKHS